MPYLDSEAKPGDSVFQKSQFPQGAGLHSILLFQCLGEAELTPFIASRGEEGEVPEIAEMSGSLAAEQ